MVTIQVKALEQYFPLVLFIMLYKLILTVESVGEMLKCDLWNESCLVVLYFPLVLFSYALQSGSDFTQQHFPILMNFF